MGKQKYQSGSVHLLITIIVSLVVLGVIGFVFWHNFMQPQTKISSNTADSTKSINNNNGSVPKADKDIIANASTETVKQQTKFSTDQNNNITVKVSTNNYHPDMTAISYSFPANWVSGGSLPTGFGMKSPDLVRNDNYSVTQGSTFGVEVNGTDRASTKDELFKLADLASEYQESVIPIATKLFVKVDGIDAIIYTYSIAEISNNFVGLLFIKNGHVYKMYQFYNTNSANPYPDLINTIVSSLKFAN